MTEININKFSKLPSFRVIYHFSGPKRAIWKNQKKYPTIKIHTGKPVILVVHGGLREATLRRFFSNSEAPLDNILPSRYFALRVNLK